MHDFPKVHRFSGALMVHPKDRVNAYIIELAECSVVVDTTLTISSAKELRSQAEALNKPIEAVLLTHGHPDHCTGLATFKDIPSYASKPTIDAITAEDNKKASLLAEKLGAEYPTERVVPGNVIADGSSLVFGGLTITFTDFGPGESQSDGMWSFWDRGIRHCFVGDLMVLNSHCYMCEGFIHQWQNSLHRLKTECDSRATKFYTGHGDDVLGMEALDWQLGYNNCFINSVAALEDRTIPVSQESQDTVLKAMKRYFPGDTNQSLLEMDLAHAIEAAIDTCLFTGGKGKAYYVEQLMLMSSGDIDKLIEKHYHPDAVMVTFDGMRRGHTELKKYYVDTLKIMGQITGLSTEFFAEIEDTVIFRATITSEGRGTVSAENGLYMRDGKIYRHIALTLLPDIDYDTLGTKWVG